MVGTPSDKMQVVGLGDLRHPATCMSCGNGNFESGYVKLGVYFDYEGEMYLCGNCVQEAAETYGMLNLAEAQYLKNQAEEALAYAESVRLELEASRERLRIYDTAFVSAVPDLTSAANSARVVAVKDATEKSGLSYRTVEQHVSGTGSGESDSKESITLAKRGGARGAKSPDSSSGNISV